MAAAYHRSFAALCAGSIPALLDVLGAPEHRSLLDVGTGTGILARRAARAGFRVDAVDAEPTMIDFARRQGGDVTFGVDRLPRLMRHDDNVDAVTANFVINHTGEPRDCLRELSRIVRSGGPVAVTIWPTGISALNSVWTGVIERSRAVRPPIPRLAPDEDFGRTTDGLHGILTEAAFRRVEVAEVSWTFTVAPDDLWSAVPAGIAVIGTVYRAQDASTRDRMRDAFVDVTDPLLRDGELRLPMTCILGVGWAT